MSSAAVGTLGLIAAQPAVFSRGAAWSSTSLRINVQWETSKRQFEGARAGAVRPAIWNQLERQIKGYRSLQPGWDGDEGLRPPEPVIQHALNLVQQLRQMHISKPPKVFAIGDGEVGFKWVVNDRFCSASIFPDGNLVAYATAPDWSVFELDEPYTRSASQIEDLAGYLKAL